MEDLLTGFLLPLFGTAGFGALIGALAAIVSGLLTTRAERKRFDAQVELEKTQSMQTDLRSLVLKMAELQSFVKNRMFEADEDRKDFPEKLLSLLKLEVGLLHDESVRVTLEEGLNTLDNMQLASDWGKISMHPVVAENNIMNALLEVAKAVARGDQIPIGAKAIIGRFARASAEALSEYEYFWTEQHGKGSD